MIKVGLGSASRVSRSSLDECGGSAGDVIPTLDGDPWAHVASEHIGHKVIDREAGAESGVRLQAVRVEVQYVQ